MLVREKSQTNNFMTNVSVRISEYLHVSSDWSRIASYLATITSHKPDNYGVLSFKMAAPRSVKVTQWVIDAMEDKTFLRSAKVADKFSLTLLQERCEVSAD